MVAVDDFATYSLGLDAPSESFAAVTPHDTNELTNVTRGVYIGTAGDLVVTPADGGADVTFVGADGVLPIRVRKVLDTGTIATGIVALF